MTPQDKITGIVEQWQEGCITGDEAIAAVCLALPLCIQCGNGYQRKDTNYCLGCLPNMQSLGLGLGAL